VDLIDYKEFQFSGIYKEFATVYQERI